MAHPQGSAAGDPNDCSLTEGHPPIWPSDQMPQQRAGHSPQPRRRIRGRARSATRPAPWRRRTPGPGGSPACRIRGFRGCRRAARRRRPRHSSLREAKHRWLRCPLLRRSPWPGKGKPEDLIAKRFSSRQIPEESVFSLVNRGNILFRRANISVFMRVTM